MYGAVALFMKQASVYAQSLHFACKQRQAADNLFTSSHFPQDKHRPAICSMQGKKSNDPLESVLHKLDYTFIDLPELIDGKQSSVLDGPSTVCFPLGVIHCSLLDTDDEEPEPEPVYTQSVYAFDASRGHAAHEQQQHQQQGPSTAVSGSYWEQLQQFSESKQPNLQASAVAPGVLGSSLAQAVQQQYQQFGQQQQQQHQQLLQQQQQQQQQAWGWQQQQQQQQQLPHEPATPPAGRCALQQQQLQTDVQSLHLLTHVCTCCSAALHVA
jgi:hypothetical protein